MTTPPLGPAGTANPGEGPDGGPLSRRGLLIGGGSAVLGAVGVPGTAWLLRGGHRHAAHRPPVSPVSLVPTLTPPPAGNEPDDPRAEDVKAVAFSPDGRTFACGHHSGTVRLWDLGARRPVRTLRGSPRIVCLAFSPDGRTLACGSGDLSARPPAHLWDLATGHRSDLPGSGWVAFSPGGQLPAVAGGGDRVAVASGPQVLVWRLRRGG